MPTFTNIGKAFPRIEAEEKVTGSAEYIEDRCMGPMLYAKIKKSAIPHGRIKRIDTSRAEALPGVRAVVTGKDCAKNRVGLYLVDRTFFAVDKVRFFGEPLAAVAATSVEIAQKAVDLIEVEYEELPAVFNPLEAMKPEAPLIHEDLGDYEVVPIFYPVAGTNISNHSKIRKGDVDKGFAEADVIIERDYYIPQMQHVTIETHKAAALWGFDGKLTVWSTAQSPFTVRQLLGKCLDMPLHKIRVVSSYIGGGFGGKAGATMEGLVIPLAQRCPGYIVRIVFTREEDLQCTFTRQAMYAHLKTGVRKDGRITALEYKMIWDGGAYTEYGVNITRAAAYSSAAAYDIPNLKTDSYCVYTNNPVGGPVRGFGMCEMQWGIERQMDEIARKLDMDPLELRLLNGLKEGSTTATGQRIEDSSFMNCLRTAAEAVEWGKRDTGKYRGKGLAGLVKAPAQPSNASSSAIVRINEDGTAHLSVSATEMGQGMLTAMCQIAAEALNIPAEKFSTRVPDTDYTPYEWQTVGSRTTYACGHAVTAAAKDALRQIKELGTIALGVPVEEVELEDDTVFWTKDREKQVPLAVLANSYMKPTGEGIHGPIIGRGSFIPSNMTNLDPETGQGNPGMFWTFGASAVELEVDPETGEITILQLATALDAGKAINPQQCKIQVHGGTVMGLGTALYEEVQLKDGRILNPNFTDYKIPTIENTPYMKGFVLETPDKGGPYGARGIGEQPMIAVGPAIANALADALGIEMNTFPMTPERVLKAIQEKEKNS